MAKSKSVVKKEEMPVALMNEMDNAQGAGFETADMSAYAVPFLRILQTNSPQINEDEDCYIKGAKGGMFFNTIANEVYGKEVKVIPLTYQRDFVEWKPNRGGFVRTHGSNPKILDRIVEVDDKNNNILDNGNVLQDSRNHYVLLADNLSAGPIILSMVSTGVKHSRKWMTAMRMLKTPNGKEAPMFSSVYTLKTTMNENDEGKWYQIGDKNVTLIDRENWVNQEQWEAAKAAAELINSGKTEADYASTVDNSDEKEPF